MSSAGATTRSKMATDIPASITIADRVETRLGTLRFVDGFPDDATTERLFDNLDFQRGVQAFLTAMPAATLAGIRKAALELGPANQTVMLWESMTDSRTLALTANAESVCAMAWIDLKDGPIVVNSPPNTLGIINDSWSQYVADLGDAGPDRGKGGKFLLLPPDYEGDAPRGYYPIRATTLGNLFISRAITDQSVITSAADNLRTIRIYPLSRTVDPPATIFVNLSGRPLNTIAAADFSFFEHVNQVVQHEPSVAIDAETLGLLATIGIEKGRAFALDERMTRILTEAAAVGHATARALTYRSRADDTRFCPDSAWCLPFGGGDHLFERDGVRLLDARTVFSFCSTGITPMMAGNTVGAGSQYAVAFVDDRNRPLDGATTYRVRLPAGVPARQFWSITVYDNQTRSMLQTDDPFPSLSSRERGLMVNPDGSIEVYFGPQAPWGQAGNWIQTVPGKGWHAMLRLYGPLQPWFDRTWQPGEIERLEV